MLEPGEVFTLGEECAGLSTGWSVVHELLPQSHFVFASEADAQLLALSEANIKFADASNHDFQYATMAVIGFPCQHFSEAGNNAGAVGNVKAVLDMIGRLASSDRRPKMLLLENVL